MLQRALLPFRSGLWIMRTRMIFVAHSLVDSLCHASHMSPALTCTGRHTQNPGSNPPPPLLPFFVCFLIRSHPPSSPSKSPLAPNMFGSPVGKEEGQPPSLRPPPPQGCIRTAVHRRSPPPPPPPGPPSPPPPPLPMFEADIQNFASAPLVPRGFRLTDFRPSSAGTIGGPWEEGGPSQPPPPPPSGSNPPIPPRCACAGGRPRRQCGDLPPRRMRYGRRREGQPRFWWEVHCSVGPLAGPPDCVRVCQTTRRCGRRCAGSPGIEAGGAVGTRKCLQPKTGMPRVWGCGAGQACAHTRHTKCSWGT